MPKRSLEEIKHTWNKRLYKDLTLPAIKQASRDRKLATKKQEEQEAKRARINEQAMVNKPFVAKVITRKASSIKNANKQASHDEA